MKIRTGPVRRRTSRVLRAVKEIVSSVYFLTLTGSIAFTCLVLLQEARTVGWVFAAFTACGLIFLLEDSIYGGRKIGSLSGYQYRLEQNQLLQIDIVGNVEVSIDLASDYVVDIPYRSSGFGIVRVRQNEAVFEMPSSAEGAEFIARTVLGIRQWPPDSIGRLPC